MANAKTAKTSTAGSFRRQKANYLLCPAKCPCSPRISSDPVPISQGAEPIAFGYTAVVLPTRRPVGRNGSGMAPRYDSGDEPRTAVGASAVATASLVMDAFDLIARVGLVPRCRIRARAGRQQPDLCRPDGRGGQCDSRPGWRGARGHRTNHCHGSACRVVDGNCGRDSSPKWP